MTHNLIRFLLKKDKLVYECKKKKNDHLCWPNFSSNLMKINA